MTMMAAYAEGLNILRHADVGKRPPAADAETTPLRNPEYLIRRQWRRSGGSYTPVLTP